MSTIATDIERLEQVITEALMEEWEAQGHNMTGKVYKEIKYQTRYEANKIILSGFMYPYANIVAAGVKPSKIPFSGRTGRGGTSLYITALQNYVKARMGIDDEKKSLSIAFAIAQTHKKEGMPTLASYRFSSTGKRTEWVGDSLHNSEDKITEGVREMAGSIISVHLDALIDKWNVLLKENTKAA